MIILSWLSVLLTPLTLWWSSPLFLKQRRMIYPLYMNVLAKRTQEMKLLEWLPCRGGNVKKVPRVIWCPLTSNFYFIWRTPCLGAAGSQSHYPNWYHITTQRCFCSSVLDSEFNYKLNIFCRNILATHEFSPGRTKIQNSSGRNQNIRGK